MSQQISDYYRDLWCKALRSGKYKQGRLFLRSGDLFCAGGVLCDVAGYRGEQRKWSTTDEVYTFGSERSIGTVPNTARIKMDASNSYLLKIAQLNDAGKTFPELADIIESREEIPLV